jgi:hypothetical protein
MVPVSELLFPTVPVDNVGVMEQVAFVELVQQVKDAEMVSVSATMIARKEIVEMLSKLLEQASLYAPLDSVEHAQLPTHASLDSVQPLKHVLSVLKLSNVVLPPLLLILAPSLGLQPPPVDLIAVHLLNGSGNSLVADMELILLPFHVIIINPTHKPLS